MEQIDQLLMFQIMSNLISGRNRPLRVRQNELYMNHDITGKFAASAITIIFAKRQKKILKKEYIFLNICMQTVIFNQTYSEHLVKEIAPNRFFREYEQIDIDSKTGRLKSTNSIYVQQEVRVVDDGETKVARWRKATFVYLIIL